MLADRLTTSEREQLLNEKPMVNFQSQQWDKAPKAHIQDHVPPHTILNKIIVRCRNEKQPLERNKKYYRIGYSIAATVAIFIIGFWIANNISSSDINISAPMNDKLAVMLPDSSEVWLNAASQIRYHKSFLNNREIFLEKGEAFFKVKKAQGAPFRVYFQESTSKPGTWNRKLPYSPAPSNSRQRKDSENCRCNRTNESYTIPRPNQLYARI